MDHDLMFWILTPLTILILVQLSRVNRRLRKLNEEDLPGQLRDIKFLLRSLSAQNATPKTAAPPPTPPERIPPTVQAVASRVEAVPAGATAAPPSPPPIPVRPAAPVPTPAAAAEPPRPPSKFVQTVTDVLGRIWQWILVGEEFRPKGVSMEYAVATTWLMRAGVVALVTCAAYFLKWSADRNLIGPAMRVGISTMFGLGMLLGGLRLLGKRWNVLGQGFTGGGLAILYFSMYALGPRYHLVESMTLVFGLMILVTVAAGVLALFTNSMLVAIFGIIGGFCTPILLSTGEPRFLALYTYLLLLNLGILGIGHARQWRLLNYLGFVFTYLIFFGSLSQYRRQDFAVVLTFLSLFFIVQSTLVFLYNIRRRVPATVLEIVHLVLNAVFYAGSAYWLIVNAPGRPWPALMTLALAVYYVAHVVLFLSLRLSDRSLLVTLISLAGFFTTLTMPLAMERESLTIAWALQALMFLWIGRGLDSNFLRHVAYALYALTFWRILAHEMPRFDLNPAVREAAAYWKALAGRLWTFGVSIGSVFVAYLLERKTSAQRTLREPAPNSDTSDTPDFMPSFVGFQMFFWGVIVCLFVYLNFELYAMFGFLTPWRPAALTTLWCATAFFFALLYMEAGGAMYLGSTVLFAAAAAGKTLFWDIPVWDLCERCYFNTPYLAATVLGRCLDFAVVLGLLGGTIALMNRRRPTPAVPGILGYAALALLWVYSTLEFNTLLHWKLPNFQAGGISVLWTIFALSFVAGGIWRNAPGIRYVGLALFAIVVVKVFVFDLAQMPTIYRVLAFMVVGVLLLLGSYAYLRASKRFTQGENTP